MFVDFNRTFISWLTKEGSYGRFGCEASLETGNQIWLLGTKVLACDVYSQADLFKEPGFYFQPLFSAGECRIFRTYLKENSTGDTIFSPSSQFIEHKLDINHVQRYSEADFSSSRNAVLMAEIQYSGNKLQFPVKHYNYRSSTGDFQIETGPVPLLLENGLSVAFVAFNSFEKFEALCFDNENGIRKTRKIKIQNCKIKILNVG